MPVDQDSNVMQKILLYISLIAAMLISMKPVNSHALAYNGEPIYFSTNVSYGIKFLNFGFLKGEQPKLRSVNISFVVLYQKWFGSLSLDESVSAARVDELGVEGDVTRRDIGVTIGRTMFTNFMPDFQRYTLSPYWYLGYSDGTTDLSYNDGLGVSFREAGMNFGLGATLFDEHTSRSFNVSFGFAILDNSELKFISEDIDRTTFGNTRGLSLDLSMSQYISRNLDFRLGFKANRYVIDFETGTFEGEAEDSLNQIYVGLRYYI